MKKLLVIGLVFVIALTVALSVLVAGCGSDDATDATETTLEQTDTTVGDDTATSVEDTVSTEVEVEVEDVTTTVAE